LFLPFSIGIATNIANDPFFRITMITAAALQKSNDTIPPVYSRWWHPHKSWKDIILSSMLSYKLPLHGIKPEKEKQVHIEYAQSLRSDMQKMMDSTLRKPSSVFHKWSAILGCDLVRVNIQVMRNDELLKKWDLPVEDEEIEFSLPSDTKIDVKLTFPVTILPSSLHANLPPEVSEYGWKELQDDNILEKIPKDIPIIVFFHMGGMVFGTPDAADILYFHNRALASLDNPHEKPMIVACVKYSFAPEYPFPAAPMECISVVANLLDQDRILHIAGTSAGGTLAIVSGIESLRAHPKAATNIRSIFAACPTMIHPAADSISMYQNSASSYVSVDFLRWCYQVYLDLPVTTNSDKKLPENPQSEELPLHDILGRNSNRQAWNESKWIKSSLARLADPTIDLPKLEAWPKIFILTNSGDPLLDDGMYLVEALQEHGAANVSHHARQGTHWFGTLFDSTSMATVAEDWKEHVLKK
jgi:acetyl esterase/lipase